MLCLLDGIALDPAVAIKRTTTGAWNGEEQDLKSNEIMICRHEYVDWLEYIRKSRQLYGVR